MWTKFSAWADTAARQIVSLSNPALDFDSRANKGWFLTQLDQALVAFAVYLLLILVGIVKRAMEPKLQPVDKSATRASESAPGLTYQEFLKNPAHHVRNAAKDRILAVQILYNVVQVGLSAYMAFAACYYAWKSGYGVICNEFNPQEQEITFVQWLFYISKAFDFLDTVFMIVRSKWAQFSFLHTYHHASIFITYWWVANTAYTGDVWAPVMANAVVHTVMYFYYLSTSVGIRPSWASKLTMFQMLQFVFMVVHGSLMLYWDCPYPQRVTTVYVAYILAMLLLFLHFYITKERRLKSKKAAAPHPKSS